MNIFDWLRRRRPQLPASAPNAASPLNLIEAWRSFIGDKKSWVLFRHGTCVILSQPSHDLHAQAIELMQKWGPVYPGSPYGDFSVLTLPKRRGWVVTSHHPDIMTYVTPDELPRRKRQQLTIGLFGRRKRDQDAAELDVIHMEHTHGAA